MNISSKKWVVISNISGNFEITNKKNRVTKLISGRPTVNLAGSMHEKEFDKYLEKSFNSGKFE